MKPIFENRQDLQRKLDSHQTYHGNFANALLDKLVVKEDMTVTDITYPAKDGDIQLQVHDGNIAEILTNLIHGHALYSFNRITDTIPGWMPTRALYGQYEKRLRARLGEISDNLYIQSHYLASGSSLAHRNVATLIIPSVLINTILKGTKINTSHCVLSKERAKRLFSVLSTASPLDYDLDVKSDEPIDLSRPTVDITRNNDLLSTVELEKIALELFDGVADVSLNTNMYRPHKGIGTHSEILQFRPAYERYHPAPGYGHQIEIIVEVDPVNGEVVDVHYALPAPRDKMRAELLGNGRKSGCIPAPGDADMAMADLLQDSPAFLTVGDDAPFTEEETAKIERLLRGHEFTRDHGYDGFEYLGG